MFQKHEMTKFVRKKQHSTKFLKIISKTQPTETSPNKERLMQDIFLKNSKSRNDHLKFSYLFISLRQTLRACSDILDVLIFFSSMTTSS